MKPPNVRIAAATLATAAAIVAIGSVTAAQATAEPTWGAKSYGPSMTATTAHSSSGGGHHMGGPARGFAAPGSASRIHTMMRPGVMAKADRVPPPGAVALQNREPDAWIPAIDETGVPMLTHEFSVRSGAFALRQHHRPPRGSHPHHHTHA